MKTPSDKKAYCFPLNASDWLASPSVKLMSKAERGVYIMLLCTAWENKATLPASEDKVRRLAEMSVDEWKESHEVLLEKFPLSECQTYRFNPRLMAEYEVQEGRRKGASLAGLKSAEARAAKEAAEAALQRNGNGMATTVAENPTTVEENANGTPTIREGKVSKENKKLASSAGQDLASPIESADAPQRPTGRPKLYRYDNAPVFLITEFFAYLRQQGYGHVDMPMYLQRIQEGARKGVHDTRKLKEEATNDEWKAFILRWLDGDKANKRLLLPDELPRPVGGEPFRSNPALQVTTSTSYSPAAIAARNQVKY